jgi:hypothetical protein
MVHNQNSDVAAAAAAAAAVGHCRDAIMSAGAQIKTVSWQGLFPG